MTTVRRAGCLLLLSLAGCATLEADDTLWLLPQLGETPRPVASPPAASQVAALGTMVLPAPGPRWPGGEAGLRLDHVLTSLDATFPLIAVAEQKLRQVEAKQLEALGAYDLKFEAGAAWAPRGFYENHTARVGLEQATGLWGLEVWGGYRLGSGDFDPTFDGKRVTNHGGELSVGAQLPLLRNGVIDARRADLLASELQRGIARDDLVASLLGYELEATAAYWSWVAAGRSLQVAQTLVELAEARQSGVLARVARGDLPEIEAVDNSRLVVRRQATRVKATRELQKRAIKLSLFLRDVDGRPLRPAPQALPGQFPAPVAPPATALFADLELALRQRPELRRLARSREEIDLRIREAENQRLPQLDLVLSASQDLNRSRPSRTKGEFELSAGIEFGFPLQNRKARGNLAARLAERDQLYQQERYLRDRVEAEVRDAFSALETSYARVALAREAARLAAQVATAERRRFGLGDSNVLQLNLREAATAEAELQVVDALVDYWIAAAAYRAAVGQRALSTK